MNIPVEQSQAITLDGRTVVAQLRQEMRENCAKLVEQIGFVPILAVLSVGDDSAARSYVAGIRRACDQTGLQCRPITLPEETTEAELCTAIEALNHEREVCGILVTLPLPAHLPPTIIATTIAPEKDIDGVTLINAGKLELGWPTFAPNTPSGGMELLRRYSIPIAGKHAVVVGRSGIVGKPMALMLLAANATVTVCHSNTHDLTAIVRQADILVTAVGRARLINGSMIKPGATVIDFGINFPEWAGGRMVGDVDFDSAKTVAGAITPVPGGTGPVTNMMLMHNTLEAAFALYVHS